MKVLKQVICLMGKIAGAFYPWSYLNRMDYYQQGGCSDEEVDVYVDSSRGKSARYYPHYQMWISHLVNRLISAGILICEYENFDLQMEEVPVDNLLCIVSDECVSGLDDAEIQRKRTLLAILKALELELQEFSSVDELRQLLSEGQKLAFDRVFEEFRCDFYEEERDFVIVLIKGKNASLLSEFDIFGELDYFVITFPEIFIMIYPSETGYSDGYVEITYGIGFLSWDMTPFLQMLYGKRTGNIVEFLADAGVDPFYCSC